MKLKKVGFLFGAGAEMGYNLPSGGKFALDIFRQDTTQSKVEFKEMRAGIDKKTSYANTWLNETFAKAVSAFGRAAIQTIMKDTIVHNRERIVSSLNEFDEIAEKAIARMVGKDKTREIDARLERLSGRSLWDNNWGQEVSFINELQEGNNLFRSHYFSTLLTIYKNKALEKDRHRALGEILLAIIQLQIGALGESLTHRINESVFKKKDDDIDLFDDLGSIFQVNYAASEMIGIKCLLDMPPLPENEPLDDDGKTCLIFARRALELIYEEVLDYKSLIDENWHYLYCPTSDWGKFCKISLFLLTVRRYIKNLNDAVNLESVNGYYNLLRTSIDNGELEVCGLATTNYTTLIKEIVAKDVAFLNGSIETWYDPYLNRTGSMEELNKKEKHLLVPLLFTQSGTKPMTSIEMAQTYVNIYEKWKAADKIVVIGFGFGVDDEHINGILRNLVTENNKELVVVTVGQAPENKAMAAIKSKLKLRDASNLRIIQVDPNKSQGKENIEDVWQRVIQSL